MTLFKDKDLLSAAVIVVNKQLANERRLIASIEKDYHSVFVGKNYCSEERNELLEGISLALFNARSIYEEHCSHRGSLIEDTYHDMERVRSIRKYNKSIISFDYKKDSDSYGLITFLDGSKDVFFILGSFIYFLVSKERYPLYQFLGDHSDCALKYVKELNRSLPF